MKSNPKTANHMYYQFINAVIKCCAKKLFEWVKDCLDIPNLIKDKTILNMKILRYRAPINAKNLTFGRSASDVSPIICLIC